MSDVDLTGRAPVSPAVREDASVGELLAETTRDLSELFRKEVELAKVELRDEAKKAGRAGAMFGAAGVLGHLAILLLTFAAAWGLAAVMPTGLAFLVVAVVVAIVAYVLVLQGKKRMAEVEGPRQTIETLQEDVEWAKQQKS